MTDLVNSASQIPDLTDAELASRLLRVCDCASIPRRRLCDICRAAVEEAAKRLHEQSAWPETIPCRFCGEAAVFDAERVLVGTGEIFAWFRCYECGTDDDWSYTPLYRKDVKEQKSG